MQHDKPKEKLTDIKLPGRLKKYSFVDFNYENMMYELMVAHRTYYFYLSF